MSFTKNILSVAISLGALAGIAAGVNHAMNSKQYVLKRVQIIRANPSTSISSSIKIPLEDSTLIRMAGTMPGKVGLFDINLNEVERGLLSHEWIKQVRLEKRLPDRLVITLTLREPKALFQTTNGRLVYVDETGRLFGEVDVASYADLPLLEGFSENQKVKTALTLLDHWERSDANRFSTLSSVHWDQERGFRVLVSYPLSNRGISSRSMIGLGQEIDETIHERIVRVSSVLRYLSNRSIAARQVWADAGKKVVVKIVAGS